MLNKVLSRTLSHQPDTDTKEAKEARRSSSSTRASRHAIHGRGGAGNIGGPAPELSTEDLATPTLKADVYTTGRGGSGNMTKNTDPKDARRAQDVISLPRRDSGSEVHVGRGGAANFVKLSPDEIEAAKRRESVAAEEEGNEAAGPAQAGFAERGKKWLFGLGGKSVKP